MRHYNKAAAAEEHINASEMIERSMLGSAQHQQHQQQQTTTSFGGFGKNLGDLYSNHRAAAAAYAGAASAILVAVVGRCTRLTSVRLTPAVLIALGFNLLKAQCFQAIAFKHQPAVLHPYTVAVVAHLMKKKGSRKHTAATTLLARRCKLDITHQLPTTPCVESA